MTTRIKGLVVALTDDIREDDIQCIINAIKMVKGVQDVSNIESSPNDWIIETRIKTELEQKIWDAFHKK